MNTIKSERELKINCPACNGSATVKTLIVKDTKPFKRISFTECNDCKITETTEEDLEKLNYGVSILCDFTEKNEISKNLKRMAFINHNTEIKFKINEKEVFSFSTMTSNVDCIEGIILRAIEILEANIVGNPKLKETKKILEDSCKNGFKMEITDKTGYSKVCPFNFEYSSIQDKKLEDINEMDDKVVHKKISLK